MSETMPIRNWTASARSEDSGHYTTKRAGGGNCCSSMAPAALAAALRGRGLAALALYLRTLAPDVLVGDSGEFQFTGAILGVPHPTGYPLYTLLGKLLSLLPVGDVAYRINLSSAVYMAAAAALLAAIVWRLLGRAAPPAAGTRGAAPAVAGARRAGRGRALRGGGHGLGAGAGGPRLCAERAAGRRCLAALAALAGAGPARRLWAAALLLGLPSPTTARPSRCCPATCCWRWPAMALAGRDLAARGCALGGRRPGLRPGALRPTCCSPTASSCPATPTTGAIRKPGPTCSPWRGAAPSPTRSSPTR